MAWLGWHKRMDGLAARSPTPARTCKIGPEHGEIYNKLMRQPLETRNGQDNRGMACEAQHWLCTTFGFGRMMRLQSMNCGLMAKSNIEY
jgi:hypothetical protein